MEEITEIYKNPYDSPEDKMAVKKAIKVVPIAQEIYDLEDKQIEDVEFKLFDIEQITLGESFKIAMSIHNTSSEMRSMSIVLSALSILYTGTTVNKIKRSSVDINLKPNQREKHSHVRETFRIHGKTVGAQFNKNYGRGECPADGSVVEPRRRFRRTQTAVDNHDHVKAASERSV